ncbi:hypothetical protein BH10ACT2_BH10ACT2_24930 [soil metagenome]
MTLCAQIPKITLYLPRTGSYQAFLAVTTTIGFDSPSSTFVMSRDIEDNPNLHHGSGCFFVGSVNGDFDPLAALSTNRRVDNRPPTPTQDQSTIAMRWPAIGFVFPSSTSIFALAL